MKKKILFISYDGMTDPLGQSQVLPYLKGLSARGYDITLLSCEKPERKEHTDLIAGICSAAGIRWVPIPYSRKPPVLSTVKDVRRLKKEAVSLHREHIFDLIHCRSYISALIGQSMKKQFGTGFLFDMRGFWADERVDGGLWNLKNPLYRTVYRFFKKKELEYLREADYTISLTQNAKEEIESWPALATARPPIRVIPCCVDLDLFDPATVSDRTKEEGRARLGIAPDALVITYLGSLGTWYLLDEMLQFFSLLKKQRPDAKMLFISHDQHEEIRRQAAVLGFSDAIIIHPAPRKEVPALLSVSDYSIYFIKDAYSKKASSPTKQGEIMAMGIPSICNNVGDMEYVCNRYGIGYSVDTRETSGFAGVAAAIAAGEKVFDPAAIVRGAQEFYALEKGVEAYAAVYEKILIPG